MDSKWKVAPTDRVIWKSPEVGKETMTESKAELKWNKGGLEVKSRPWDRRKGKQGIRIS